MLHIETAALLAVLRCASRTDKGKSRESGRRKVIGLTGPGPTTAGLPVVETAFRMRAGAGANRLTVDNRSLRVGFGAEHRN